jgi:hypothetical protein
MLWTEKVIGRFISHIMGYLMIIGQAEEVDKKNDNYSILVWA